MDRLYAQRTRSAGSHPRIAPGLDGATAPERGRWTASPRTAAVVAALVLLAAAPPLRGQAIEDAMLLPQRTLATGLVGVHESWTEYWEGTLKRDNENIGRVTTQSAVWMTAYGVTDRLTLLAMLPYVRTHASQGTLKGMRGIQDLTIAAKYNLLTTPFTDRGTLTALVVGAAGTPLTDYSPDFLPLSIGLGSRRASGRFSLHFQAHDGWFLNGTSAYTWRGNVELDRHTYYTDGKLYDTREVAMPNVFDYTVGGGFRKGRLQMPISVTEQRTLGGGDIRRQDMPFVSNRMDFVRVDGAVAYALPSPGLMVRVGAGHVVRGRNVGRATTLSTGVLYMFPF